MGLLGFRAYYSDDPIPYNWLDYIYYTFQLLTLNSGSVVPPLPLSLELARILAPAVFSYTVLRGLFVLFGDRINLLRLRWMQQHVIVCGCGRKGRSMAMDFLDRGQKVVIIGRDSDRENLAFMRDQGALPLVGDATQGSVLLRAGLLRCQYVVAACGLDGTNAAIAIAASRELDRHENLGRRITGLIHLANPRLHLMLRRYELLQGGGAFALSPFNIHQISARRILTEHPLDREGILPESAHGAHLVIFGLGILGESLLLQALRIGHYANRTLLKVTVLDRIAALHEKELLLRFPALHDLADIEFIETDCKHPDALTRVPGWDQGEGHLWTVAVCFDNDSTSLNIALMLAARLRFRNIPILCRLTQDEGLATLVRDIDNSEDIGCDIHPFGEIDRAADVEHVIGAHLDDMAKAVHEHYLRKRQAEGQAMKSAPAMHPWDHLPEELRASNREQADHIPVKARALGMAIRSLETNRVEPLTDQQVEVLARMEHARWRASRILQGWTYGPERDNALRKSPYLAPWNGIDEATKELDREAVREIPKVLQEINKGLFPCPLTDEDA
jgi:voltage-gated potassium channel Kch